MMTVKSVSPTSSTCLVTLSGNIHALANSTKNTST